MVCYTHISFFFNIDEKYLFPYPFFQFIKMTEKLLMIDKGLFYVVEFFDGIQIIPDNWIIQDESLAYWPKVKSDKDYDTMVYTRNSVKDDWSLEPIKEILYKTGLIYNNIKIL